MRLGDPLQTLWFDGRSPRPRAVRLRLLDGQLTVEPLDAEADGAPRRYPVRQLRWPERRSHGQRQTELPDGGLLQHADAPEWDAWWAAQGQTESWVVGLQQSWRAVAGALLLTIGLLGATWIWGVPAASQFVAQRLPLSLETGLGESSLRKLDEALLAPTRLPLAQTRELEARWRAFVERSHGGQEPPAWQLHWRHAPGLGPNALALPGGHIVVTDQLVALLNDQPDTLVGVMAHELGHVHYRDGMDALVRASLLSALVGVVLGDMSGFVATVPAALLTQSYSRETERRADAYAAALMHQGGVSPAAMLPLFQRLAERARAKGGPSAAASLPMALASHPADEERVRFFREWSPRP